MTPLQIMMLLHYHVSARPYAENDHAHAYSEAVTAQREILIIDELLILDTASPSGFRTTERGRVYVEALLRTPLPVKKCLWSMP